MRHKPQLRLSLSRSSAADADALPRHVAPQKQNLLDDSMKLTVIAQCRRKLYAELCRAEGHVRALLREPQGAVARGAESVCVPNWNSHSTSAPERFAYMIPIAARERQRCDRSG